MLFKKSPRPTKGSDLTAFIDEGSEIEGQYSFTGTVMINGKFIGNVFASERVELRGAAKVQGDVESPVVVLEEGVLFDGHCKMRNARSGDAAGEAREGTVVALKR